MSYKLPHPRGVQAEIIPTPYNSYASVVVLGGPMEICGKKLYTCLCVKEGILEADGRNLDAKPGENYMIREDWITLNRMPLVWTEQAIKHAQNQIRAHGWTAVYNDVIEKWCPNCEVDDMIFYAEDYICSWCREMIEV